jgi:hypothetical protein
VQIQSPAASGRRPHRWNVGRVDRSRASSARLP